MTTQFRLEEVAQRYRGQGYQVTLNPGPADLPDFARNFKFEILAIRPDGNVLVSAKASKREFERDPALSEYASAIEKHPDWRYDIFALGPPPPPTEPRDASDASDAEIDKLIDDSQRLVEAGFVPQAVLTAWGALEAAMRHRLRAAGGSELWEASTREMLDEMYSSGILSRAEFRDLERFSRLRNTIAHGFWVPQIDGRAVAILTDSARRLLEESKSVESVS